MYPLLTPPWPVRAVAVAAMAVAMLGVPLYAQQPAQPKATQPKTKAPAPAPAPAAPPPAAAAGPSFTFTFSPWTKQCVKPNDPNAKQVCITSKDGFLEDGRLAVSTAVVESEGDAKKLLKVMLAPFGLQIPPGTRVAVDQGQPMSGPYAACFPNGCFADYEATTDLIGRMKQGQNLVVQAVSVNNQIISVSLPLGEFGKAIDGPPTDPKVFEEQRKKLQEELERKAREFQQRMAPAGGPKQ
jgi:invasion protein IalB